MERGDEKGGEGNPPKVSRINIALDPPLPATAAAAAAAIAIVYGTVTAPGFC